MNKKFALLLVLLAAMVMGSVASASAAEVKATGTWQIAAEWMDRTGFSDNVENNTFRIAQRMRTGFQFVANENLKAVLDTQIGTTNWGQGVYTIGSGRNTSANGPSGANGAAIMLRNGYLAFNVPGTKIASTVGFQQVALPSAVGGGSPILDDHMGAAVVSVPVIDKTLALVGGFGRALQGTDQTGSGSAMDAAFLIADYNPTKGVNLKPYVAYAYAGAKSGVNAVTGFTGNNASLVDGVRAYYGGIAAEVSVFDPIKVMADFHYGKATFGHTGASTPGDNRSGWLFDMQIDYTGLSMMTPSLIFAYSSGEGDPQSNGSQATKNSGRMPVIGSPENYALGSFFLQGSNTFADGIGGTNDTNLGYWTLGVQLRDIKLIDKLSHTFNVLYFKGTNNDQYVRQMGGRGDIVYGQFLTTKDSLWEIDLNTKYDIYSELAAYVSLGYINPDFDKGTWSAYSASNKGNKDAYRAAFTLTYSF